MSQTLSPERIRADIAELLGCDPDGIAPDENLVDLGLDSVRIMVLVERWRAREPPRWSSPISSNSPNWPTGQHC